MGRRFSAGFDLLYKAAVPDAFYSSGLEFNVPQNDETQADAAVLEKISDWVNFVIELTAVMMWLYGPAGAGKSVIARAMAEILESRNELLATFFFSRSDPSRNHIKSVIATLAYNITLSIPASRPLIAATIERDPHIFHGSFECQFKKLILEPLQQLSKQGVTCPTVVIIDGLDECLNHDERAILLRTISIAAGQHSVRLRFLITSRPEITIAKTFNASPLNGISLDIETRSIHQLAKLASPLMQNSGRFIVTGSGITCLTLFFFDLDRA